MLKTDRLFFQGNIKYLTSLKTFVLFHSNKARYKILNGFSQKSSHFTSQAWICCFTVDCLQKIVLRFFTMKVVKETFFLKEANLVILVQNSMISSLLWIYY